MKLIIILVLSSLLFILNVAISQTPTITANSNLLEVTIDTGESTLVNANCTCSDGPCENVYIIIQNSTDDTNWGITPVDSEDIYVNASNYSIGSLSGSSINYTFNISVSTAGTYYFRAQCNSTNTEPIQANSSSSLLTANQAYGYLNVTLNQPFLGSSNNVRQNRTFIVNASVNCTSSNPTAICGEVNGTVRYNASGSNEANQSILTTEGVKPFWTSENPKTCGMLNASDLCNLTWLVNATGDIGTEWYIDVNFTSNETAVLSNDTDDATINIVCFYIMTLQWDFINFSSLYPGDYSNAVGNDDRLYNITVDEDSCAIDLYIKGEDLTKNETESNYIIGVGNVTWNTTNQYPGFSLANTYALINSSVDPNTNITMYYWIDAPSTEYGNYNGTVWISGVEPGESP